MYLMEDGAFRNVALNIHKISFRNVAYINFINFYI